MTDASINNNRTTHDLNESENENDEEQTLLVEQNGHDDDFLEKFQEQQRKREKLETKARISHRVYCPFYPEVCKKKKKRRVQKITKSFVKHIFFFLQIKQECWWLYVADRKRNALISLPIYICSLKDQEEVNLNNRARERERAEKSVFFSLPFNLTFI